MTQPTGSGDSFPSLVEKGNLTRREAAARAELVSDVRYRVDLDLTAADDRFRCDATIRFRARSGNTLTFLDYAGSPWFVECNGTTLDTGAYHAERVYVPTVAGENVVRVVGAAPYGRSGVGLHRFRDPEDGQSYLHTRFRPFEAHRVYPCFDQPDLRATLEPVITVDERWRVLANTEPVGEPEPLPGGRALWAFAPTPPLPPYLTTLVTGPFHRVSGRHGDLPLMLCARPGLSEELESAAEELFELIGHGLDHYERLLKRPYPFAKYDHVFVPECAVSAAEHPGCVVVDENLLFCGATATAARRRRRAEVLLRAMAHMWFGGLVGIRWWNGLWLREGMATMLAAQAQQAVTPFGTGWPQFEQRVRARARHADRLPTSRSVAEDVPDTGTARASFDAIARDKGASVLLQLADHLGWEGFVDGLSLFVEHHAWSTADPDDLLASLRSATATDLTEWAEEWLTQPGVDVVEVFRPGSGATAVHLSDPPPHPRRLQPRIGCYTSDGPGLRLRHNTVLHLDRRGSVRAPCRAADLVLPNDDGRTHIKVRLDPASRRALLNAIATLADPTARAVAWGALWDDVLDARLAARVFVATVLRHAPLEKDAESLRLLCGRAVVAAIDYGERSNTAPLLHAMHTHLRGELDLAMGLDRQLALADALLRSAAAEHDSLLYDIALRRPPWQELTIDRNLRWRALLRLAAHGRPVEDLVAAELAAEPRSDGRRRALSVEAARPRPSAKEQSWHRVFSGAHSLAERQAIMAGFRQPGQEDVLTPYAERYFTVLESVWQAEGPECARSVARGLYPRVTDAEQEVLARTDDVLQRGRLPQELLRVLLEQRGELALARAARARDAVRTRAG